MQPAYPTHQLLLGQLVVEVISKPIQHLHLSVVPPDGAVRIAAPQDMPTDHVRAFAIGKLGWIRKQQARFATQQRESPRLVVERETHHLWGQPLLLQIQEVQAAPRVEVHPRRLLLFVRPQSSLQKRQSFLAAWYRQELRKEALPLIEIWQQCLVALRSPPLCRRLRSSQTRRIIAACQAPEPGRIYGEGSTPTSAHGIPRPGGASGLSNGHHRRAKGDQAR
jgi:predicted metal-dependent hydrolase